MYQIWKTNQENYEISKMDDKHIKNCLNMIEKNMKINGVKLGDGYLEYEDDNNGILSPDWYDKYANGYIIAFKEELKRRKVN